MASIRVALLATSLVLAATPGAAAPYALVGLGSGAIWFIDVEAAGQPSGSYRRVESYMLPADGAMDLLSRRTDDYDCRDGRSRPVRMENLNFAGDRLKNAYDIGDRPWETPPPGSPAAVALKMVCSRDFSSSQVSGQGLSPAAYAAVIRTEQLNFRQAPVR